MYDQVVKCQRAGLCLSEHFLIVVVFVLDRLRLLRLLLFHSFILFLSCFPGDISSVL